MYINVIAIIEFYLKRHSQLKQKKIQIVSSRTNVISKYQITCSWNMTKICEWRT